MVLSFDLSLRGAGVSSLLIVLAVNVIVTPQLLKSWEQGTLRDDPRRQLQASRPETPYPCVKTVSCDQPVDWDGAVAACAEVGAAVCELAQFEDAGAALAGCTDSENPREVSTALVESDQCPNPNERLVITNACTDWGNDCCIAKDGDVAQCATGYDVVQLQGGGDCYDPDLFRPTFECVPRVPVAEPNCVATSTRANRVVCCAAQACMENGGRDNDCCTMQGGGGCLGGYTYVEKSGIGAIPDDVGCPLHARNNPGMNLVGTVCVPNTDTAMAAQPNDIFYINFEDPGWTCKGRDDGGGGRPDAFVALINLLFAFGWSTIVGIVCCYCRNKSQNTAPFNGGAVKSFPQIATATAPTMQIVQIQCPEGVSPGQTMQANINGQSLDVQIPDGVAGGTMFQVQVPIMPQAPGFPVLNPLTAPQASAFDNSALSLMGGMHINQVVDIGEMVTGCEAKNRYTCHEWSPGQGNVGRQVFFIREESDGCERVCCKQQRHLSLYIHDGHDKTGNVIMQVHKSFGLAAGLCCCRPEVMIFDGNGEKVGNVENPWKCCTMDQRIFGPDGQQIYGAAGTVCQQGIFCPCLGSVEFALTDAHGQPNDGSIQKIFNGCAEVMAKANSFRVAFPAGATVQQKMALIGCTLLIDFEYFERK